MSRSTSRTVLGLVVLLSPLCSLLSAQAARDSLGAGRRAYEAVDYEAAARLLPIGLAGSARDSAWVVGIHMLTDVLLEQNNDSLARLWARWATRTAPAFPIDSNAFPPRVTAVLTTARSFVGTPTGSDSASGTTWETAGDPTSGRGVLRLARAPGITFAAIESVGTILPGESRTLRAGTYTLRIAASGFPSISVTREILPGFATNLTPLPIRIEDAAASGPAPAGQAMPAAPAASRLPVRGSMLSAAGWNTCAIIERGRLTCWGADDAGQLGGGFVDSTWHAPVIVSGDEAFRVVTTGGRHACALTFAGKAWCWGLGTSGQLGTGQSVSSASPVAVAGGQVFLQISAGGRHTCGLSGSGAVLCWGANSEGQLGTRGGNTIATPTVVTAPGGATFTAVSAGSAHSCALAANGASWCWGANGSGQLGNGSTSDANAPALLQAVPFRALAAGGLHTCALTPAGAAYCWGVNTGGQSGSGETGEPVTRPSMVAGGMVFDSIAAGESHSCGLTSDGAAYCWGVGRAGQLGNGQSGDSPRPVLVVGGHVFRDIDMGINHSCGVTTDSITQCWGLNTQGQLGSLVARASATPVPVLVRPAPHPRPPDSAVATDLREWFGEGWTAGQRWKVDAARGARVGAVGGALEVVRQGSRGAVQGAGISIPVRIRVTRATQIQFDVQLLADSLRGGCGLNCAGWPAIVRVRVKNSDLTESEIWYAYNDTGGAGRTLGGVVIVARGDAPAGQWLRDQRFTIRDAAPRADSILQVSLGGIGADFGARFDNLFVPVPVLTSLELRPDSLVLTNAAPAQPLRAAARDADGRDMPWVRAAWSISDTTIARVDSLGVVTGLRTGRALIKAQVGTLADSARVRVRITRPVRR